MKEIEADTEKEKVRKRKKGEKERKRNYESNKHLRKCIFFVIFLLTIFLNMIVLRYNEIGKTNIIVNCVFIFFSNKRIRNSTSKFVHKWRSWRDGVAVPRAELTQTTIFGFGVCSANDILQRWTSGKCAFAFNSEAKLSLWAEERQRGRWGEVERTGSENGNVLQTVCYHFGKAYSKNLSFSFSRRAADASRSFAATNRLARCWFIFAFGATPSRAM